MKAGLLFPVAIEYRYRLSPFAMAQSTGEHRIPRKGDWFLSGAIVEAYRATADLPQPYDIARLVYVTTTTQYRVTGLVDAS